MEAECKLVDGEHLRTQLLPVFFKYRQELVVAYLFGSVAEGTHSPLSDVDIAVLFKSRNKKNLATLKLQLYADVCRALKRNDVDLVVLSLSGNLILNDQIIRHGVTLYSADDASKDEFELKVLHRCADFKFQRHYAMGV